MPRLMLGRVSQLCAPDVLQRWLSPALREQAPVGQRRSAWLAGRLLLAMQRRRGPLPPLQGAAGMKPALPAGENLFFNLSHSGDVVASLVDETGEVGCDVEVIRPRMGWQDLAQAYFGTSEQQRLASVEPEQQLALFWHFWTVREAILKQHGGSVWSMGQVDVSGDGLMRAGLHVQGWVQDGVAIAAAYPLVDERSGAGVDVCGELACG